MLTPVPSEIHNPMENPASHLNRVAIIQARMSASRLPGKVLLDIAGEPMLVRVVERMHRAKTVDRVLVATSLDESDDPILTLCQQREYPCFRGSLQDVLDRYYNAAKWSSADVVIRITGDCPIIDPMVVDQTMAAFYGRGSSSISESGEVGVELFEDDDVPVYDFAANRLPPPWQRTFPIGLDTEVCTFSALEIAWREADQPHQREHVMPYLYENDGKFKVLLVNHDPDFGHLRWTVDTSQDLELLRQIYSRFDGRDDFSWLQVLELFEEEPGLAEINAGVAPKDYQEVEKIDK